MCGSFHLQTPLISYVWKVVPSNSLIYSDIQTEVELHSLYRRVNSISIVGFSFKV